jgi:hypothetical protein
MTQNKNEMIRENTERTEKQENEGERHAGFLPIFYWTD